MKTIRLPSAPIFDSNPDVIQNPKSRIQNPARGISLIEMMICLTMLAVVALALADSMVVSMRATGVTEERAAATRAARNALERMVAMKRSIINRATGYANLSNGNTVAAPAQQLYPQALIDTGADWGTGANYGTVLNMLYSANGQPAPFTFDVTYTRVNQGVSTQVSLQGMPNSGITSISGLPQVGEIVVMFDERVSQNAGTNMWAYGRDLTGAGNGGPNGKPDGVNFVPIGDMDMDGIPAAGPTSATGTADVRPVIFANNSGRMPVGAIVRWEGADGTEQRVEMWSVVDFSVFNTVKTTF